jgi:hypothetical protein
MCQTVGELVAALQQLPQDIRLAVTGADCGGYDVTFCPVVTAKVESVFTLDKNSAKLCVITGRLDENDDDVHDLINKGILHD